MDIRTIQYRFNMPDSRQEIVDVRLDSRTFDLVTDKIGNLPPWTNLDFHQCPHCPLDIQSHPACPVAASLVDVVTRFDNVLSHHEIDLEVVMTERHVVKHTTAQRGISSLLGLIFPSSGCPHAAFFKPMVRFHLPLATEDDTIFRAVGMYLLAQYFLQKSGHEIDFDLNGLKQIYKNLNLVNIKIADRLRSATKTDSSVNALILLDVFTHAITFSIEDHLAEMRHLFAPYLSNFYELILKDFDISNDFEW